MSQGWIQGVGPAVVLALLIAQPSAAYAGPVRPAEQLRRLSGTSSDQTSLQSALPPNQGPPIEFRCPPSVIGFEPGSATISKKAAAYLLSNIPRIKNYCAGSVVVGFADPSDKFADLELLARRRARVVADFLIQGGLDPSLVSVQTRLYSTFGSETPDKAAENRIVEVRDNN